MAATGRLVGFTRSRKALALLLRREAGGRDRGVGLGGRADLRDQAHRGLNRENLEEAEHALRPVRQAAILEVGDGVDGGAQPEHPGGPSATEGVGRPIPRFGADLGDAPRAADGGLARAATAVVIARRERDEVVVDRLPLLDLLDEVLRERDQTGAAAHVAC